MFVQITEAINILTCQPNVKLVLAVLQNSDLFIEHYEDGDIPSEDHIFGRFVIRVQRHDVDLRGHYKKCVGL
jgi:hypothetical protein